MFKMLSKNIRLSYFYNPLSVQHKQVPIRKPLQTQYQQLLCRQQQLPINAETFQSPFLQISEPSEANSLNHDLLNQRPIVDQSTCQFYLTPLQYMYKKETPLVLLIIELINVVFTLAFLLLFAHRFCQLRAYSHTLRYKNYFPKLRILFVLSYVVLGITLLTYNLATGSYEISHWYEYLLQGGGGQCINSIILLVQLGVLRFQLNKEQPYTKYHLMLFVYLLFLEVTRFIFTLLDVINDQNDDANLIISSIITADALIQLFYWLFKRQSLPQFINPIDVQIDDLSYHTRLIQSRNQRSQKSTYRRDFKNQNFSYLIPNVGYQNGKIKIILQLVSLPIKLYDNRTTKSAEKLPIQESNDRHFPISFDEAQRMKKKDALTVGYYTHEQIKKLYAICGRYNIKYQLQLDTKSISELIQSLKLFLEQVFSLQNCYQQDILEFFRIPRPIIKQYHQILEKCAQERLQMDRKMGIPIPWDQNAPFLSVICYKYLWVLDHYKFYFKVSARNQPFLAYPYKKYHDFEEFYHSLKKILKSTGKKIELPGLPKRNSYKNNPNQLLHLLQPLQLFIRKISNDENLMKNQQTHDLILQFLQLDTVIQIQPKFQPYFFNRLRVEARLFSFDIRRYESVMVWQFTLTKGKETLKTLSKEYQQLQTLDSQLKRYLRNNNIPKPFSLPLVEKREKKEKILIEIAKYLQQVASLQNIQQCYAVASFFDIYNCNKMIKNFKERQKLIDTAISSNSQRQSEDRSSCKRSDVSGFESNRISEILSDLGNEALD